jgi:hypothetical protein
LLFDRTRNELELNGAAVYAVPSGGLMNRSRVWTIVGCCGLGLAALAWSQAKQKPGLWEVTTQMNMRGANAPQMPQLPPGVQLPPGMQMPASPFAPQTTQVCVTQAMIDKYGGPYSNPPRGNCKLKDVELKPGGMTATMTCSGQFNGTGTVQATFVDANTTKVIEHLTGTAQMGPNSQPMDMTVQSTSTYKGPDCGSVQPMAMPASQ